MLSKKSQWLVALTALSLMTTVVACGKKKEDAQPVGANPCTSVYGNNNYMNGYVNPSQYPQCQPSNAYLYPNGQIPQNGVYPTGYQNGYNYNYNYNWQAQAQAQAQWQYQMQLQNYYYQRQYYNNSCCPSSCWNYNGMYYGYAISGDAVLWSAKPMTKEQLSAPSSKDCEHPVKAKLDEKGVLTVTDDKDEIVFSRGQVEAVAQKCDQVRYSQKSKLYEYDAKTGTVQTVPAAKIEELKAD